MIWFKNLGYLKGRCAQRCQNKLVLIFDLEENALCYEAADDGVSDLCWNKVFRESLRVSARIVCWNGEPTRIREKIAVAGENLNVHSLFWLSGSSSLQFAVLEQCWKVFESSSLAIWTPVSNLTWFLPGCISVDGCLSCLIAFLHQEIITLFF